MANAWLLPPGASMIELLPYGFDATPAHLQYSLFNFEVCQGPRCGCFGLHSAAAPRPLLAAHHGPVRPACSFCSPHPAPSPHPPTKQDSESRVLWWVLALCDPALSTPGVAEAVGAGTSGYWAKNRNVLLPWPALQHALAAAVAAGGDAAAYRQQARKAGRWHWWVLPGGELREIGPESPQERFRHKRCPVRGAAEAEAAANSAAAAGGGGAIARKHGRREHEGER